MAEDINSLIELLRRNTDEFGWLQPLLDDPDSLAAVGGIAAVFARLGPAVIHNRDAGLISAASGGQKGACSVTATRTNGSSSGTIPAGYPFVDPRGVRLRTQADFAVAAGVLVVVIPCATERETELVDFVDDQVVAVASDAPAVKGTPPSLNLIGPPGDPANGPRTFSVFSASPIDGGAADYLSVHGKERGILRQTGEAENDYRARVRNIPDVVSPIAVGDIVAASSQYPGFPAFSVLEPFRDGADPYAKELHRLGAFDVAAVDATPADYPIANSADFADDALVELGDRRTVRAYMRIEANDYVQDVGGLAMFCDDGYCDDPVLGYADAWINFPPGALAALFALVHNVRVSKAGGVAFDVFLKAPGVIYGIGTGTSSSIFTAWTLAPPAGSTWLMVEALLGHSSPNPVPEAGHFLNVTLLDGSVISVGNYFGSDSRRVLSLAGKYVRSIQGIANSNGTTPVTFVGTFRVHELKGI